MDFGGRYLDAKDYHHDDATARYKSAPADTDEMQAWAIMGADEEESNNESEDEEGKC